MTEIVFNPGRRDPALHLRGDPPRPVRKHELSTVYDTTHDPCAAPVLSSQGHRRTRGTGQCRLKLFTPLRSRLSRNLSPPVNYEFLPGITTRDSS